MQDRQHLNPIPARLIICALEKDVVMREANHQNVAPQISDYPRNLWRIKIAR